ncbi:MAG: hypothetical protein H0X37_11355 [Herpetosiphonaceae bacterium]|nr:hypothetical protein [Herpetosiphonaceae bacterium]
MLGTASASGGAATLGGGSTTPLTVDFHEPGFVSQLNQHNAVTGSMGFWFQLSSEEQRKAESPMGPANPQALNRYSYVLNNPLRYTDPTGHSVYISCAICGDWFSIATWSPWAKYVMFATCMVIGCHVDFDRDVVAGPTREEFATMGITSMVSVVGGPLTGFTRHGLDQIISRDEHGVSNLAILDTLKNPLQVIEQKNGTYKWIGQYATLVLNDAGKVVSAWATSREGWRY